MNFDFNYTVDLRERAIAEHFLIYPNLYRKEAENIPNFRNVIKRTAGSEYVSFNFFTRDYYELVSKQRVVGNFNVVIPRVIKLKLTLYINLFIGNGVGVGSVDEQKIVNSFNSFNPLTGITANEYMKDEAQLLNLSPDLIELGVSYDLEPIDEFDNPQNLISITTEIDKIKQSFNSNDTDSEILILTDENGNNYTIGKYLDEYKRVIVRKIPPKTFWIGDLEVPEEEIFFDYVPKKTNYESENIADLTGIIERQSENLDCPDQINSQRIEIPIAKIENWKEFKCVWIWKDVTVGCLKTRMFLPVLQRQINKKTVIAYIAHADTFISAVKSQIEECAKKSALYAGVIGIIQADIEAAVNLFRGFFTDCIEYNISQDLYCLVPGLFILKEIERDWEEFDWLNP